MRISSGLSPRRLYGLIGYPIAHSLSPRLFSESELAQEGSSYQLFPMESLDGLLDLLRAYRPSGLNVTSPYKEQILQVLPNIDLSPEVLALGAANVLALTYTEGHACGIKAKAYNTDVFGFLEGLRPLLLGHERTALILGTGGAARAAHYALTSLGIRAVFASRCLNKVEHAYFGQEKAEVYAYEELSCLLPNIDIVVQATPLGRVSQLAPPLDYSLLPAGVLGYELNYGLGNSPFMLEILKRGGRVIDGLSMLNGQAQASYRIWRSLI